MPGCRCPTCTSTPYLKANAFCNLAMMIALTWSTAPSEFINARIWACATACNSNLSHFFKHDARKVSSTLVAKAMPCSAMHCCTNSLFTACEWIKHNSLYLARPLIRTKFKNTGSEQQHI